MNILEFLRSLHWEFNLYEVTINWIWHNYCPECKKYVESEDEEYSHGQQSVDEYRDNEGHHIDYPCVYETPIAECDIHIERMKITITHYADGEDEICEACKEADC